MRKILLIVLAFVLLGSGEGYSQLVHVKGVRGFLGEFSIEKNGFGVGIGYSKIQTKSMFWRASVEYHSTKHGFTNVGVYNAYGSVGYTFFSVKQQLFFNLMGGLGFGIENLKDDLTEKKESSPILMEGLGVGVEWCPIERITTSVSFQQRFSQLNKNGFAFYMLTIGVQYNFN